jgi:hypothetical protein
MSDVSNQISDFYHVYNKCFFWNQILLVHSSFMAIFSLFGTDTIQQFKFDLHFHIKF